VKGIGIRPSAVVEVVRANTSFGWKLSEIIQTVGINQRKAGIESARTSQ